MLHRPVGDRRAVGVAVGTGRVRRARERAEERTEAKCDPVRGQDDFRVVLAVRPREVVDALERCLPAEGAVSAGVIVGLECWGEGERSLAVVRVGAGVGPGLEQSTDEAFDLAVGPGPVRGGCAWL